MPDHCPIRVGICGEFQVGKSILINCLLGRQVALVGNRVATTPFPVEYHWAESPGVELKDSTGRNGCRLTMDDFMLYLHREHNDSTGKGQVALRKTALARVGLPCSKLQQITLVDTPGINAVNPVGWQGNSDETKALAALTSLDCAVLVRPNHRALMPGKPEWLLARKLEQLKIPFVIVMNCHHSTEWDPGHSINHSLVRESASAPGMSTLHWLLPIWNSTPNPGQDDAKATTQNNCNQTILPINAVWKWMAETSSGMTEKEIGWKKRITNEETFDGGFPTPERLRRASQIPDLEHFLFSNSERAVGVNAYCLGMLQRAGKKWSEAAAARMSMKLTRA